MGKKPKESDSDYYAPTKAQLQKMQESAARAGITHNNYYNNNNNSTASRADKWDWNAGKLNDKWYAYF